MTSDTVVSINKEFFPPERAMVSVFDHGFLFGNSVYEALRTYQGVPFALGSHLQRLERSASRLCLPLPYSRHDIALEVIKGCQMREGETKVRIVVTRGVGEVHLAPDSCRQQNLVIFFLPHVPFRQQCYSEGVKIALVNVERNSKKATDPNVKSGNYLNNVLATIEASQQKALEGVMLNANNCVTECCTSNIFLFKSGCLITSDLGSGILKGITRELIIKLAKQAGLPFEERSVAREELFEADEVFLTSSLKNIMPVRQISEHFVSSPVPGPCTQILMDMLSQTVRTFKAKYPSSEDYLQSLNNNTNIPDM